MNKLFKYFAFIAAIFVLVACDKGNNNTVANTDNEIPTKIVVGASNVPHAEILEFIKPELLKQGIDLKIVIFQDYILPNKALAGKELDANFFQHIPYLEKDSELNPNYHFVNLGPVHLEPLGFYSKRYKSLKDLPNDALIIGSNNPSERGRMLSAFVQENLITLKEGINIVTANIEDINSNPKNLIFKLDIDAALTPQIYNHNEADVVIINGNYALGAGLDHVNEPIFVENPENNPYANIIVAREEDKEKPALKKLMTVLQSDVVKKFIDDKYKGAVIFAGQ